MEKGGNQNPHRYISFSMYTLKFKTATHLSFSVSAFIFQTKISENNHQSQKLWVFSSRKTTFESSKSNNQINLFILYFLPRRTKKPNSTQNVFVIKNMWTFHRNKISLNWVDLGSSTNNNFYVIYFKGIVVPCQTLNE